MINLLPVALKDQLRFARLNVKAIRILWLVIFVIVLIGGAFFLALWRLDRQDSIATARLADLDAEISQYAGTEAQVSALNARLNSIKAIQGTKAQFSQVLSDLAAVTPQGIALSGLTLTGDDQKSIQLDFTAPNFSRAVAFRETLLTSPRIAAADIEQVRADGGTVRGLIVISFKPGQAR